MAIIEEMSADPKEWEMHESRRRAIMNYNTSMEAARREGIASGLEEGEKVGLAKGKIEGEKIRTS